MIEQPMKLSRETIEQRREERKEVKRKNRRKRITRHCCQQCGQPKHYICLEHNHNLREPFFKRLPKQIKYYSRKLYFTMAKKAGFVS